MSDRFRRVRLQRSLDITRLHGKPGCEWGCLSVALVANYQVHDDASLDLRTPRLD